MPTTTSAEGLRALCGSLVAITTIIAALRFYTRKVQQTSFGADDWLIIPAYVTFIGMVAFALLGVHLGQFGYSEKQVKAFHVAFNVEASLVVSLDILSTACLGFARISALLFYRRIFCVLGRTSALKVTIYCSIAVISLWMTAFIILPPLQCGPNLSVWSAPAKIRAMRCGMGNKIILGFCISDLLIETTVIIMPIPKILQLRTSLKRRLAVLFVFLTAFVSLGAVISRLVITVQLLGNLVEDKSEANTTQTFMWILEAGFALIAVNLPSLWWLKHKIQPERVLASVRSALSLRSMRSSNNDGESKNSRRMHNGWARSQNWANPYASNQTDSSSQEKLPTSSYIGMVPLQDNTEKRATSPRSAHSIARSQSLPEDAVNLGYEPSDSRQIV